MTRDPAPSRSHTPEAPHEHAGTRRRRIDTPLLVGFAIAMLLHALGVPWLLSLVGGSTASLSTPAANASVHTPLPPPTPEVQLGQDKSLVSTVAWIAYEDFRELVGDKSTTEQPALQAEVEPVPDAAPTLDATPPAPPAEDEQQTASASPQPEPSPQVAAAEPPTAPLDLPEQPSPEPMLAVARVPDEVNEAPPTTQPVTPDPRPAPQDAPQPRLATAAPAQPTSAPLQPREASPTQLEPLRLQVTPGRVVAAPGLEIQTFAPDLAVAARFSIPDNPEAIITFNPQGQVISVQLLRSTGAENWDGPIEASLYRWRATGPRLKELKANLPVTVRILLRSE